MAQIRNKTETKITVKIPTYLEGKDKVEVGNRIIEFIRERTLEGKNVYNKSWSGKAGVYTKEYAKKKGYKSPVDLELTSAMLSAMKQFKSKEGEIKIGYTKGTKQERKAEGNILGTYGQPSPISGKARPFLDILKKDVDNIISDYIEEVAKKQGKKKQVEVKKAEKVKGRELKQDIRKPGEFTFG